MQDIHDKIAFAVRSHFPDFYQEEGENFIDFVEAYFEFLEDTDQTIDAARNLLVNRDVDTAADSYITHFRKKYLNNFPKIADYDDAFLIKNIQDIYKSKGSQQAVTSMMQLMFHEEASIEYPGDKIIRPSSGEYIRPRYIELEVKDRNASFIGKQITGRTSQATAFVENIATLSTLDKREVDVAYLTNIRGSFQTGELISDSTGDTVGSPKIVGSLTSLTVTNGGRDFNIGDVFDIISLKGFRGKARVTATVDQTGRVDFTLVDGGTGYTLSTVQDSSGAYVTEVIVSNNVVLPSSLAYANGDAILMSQVAQLANAGTTTAINQFDTLEFPYAELTFNESTDEFNYGDVVELENVSGNTIANTFVVAKSSTNTMIVSIESNTAAVTLATKAIHASNTDANAVISIVTNETVSANVTGLNSTAFGIHGYTNANTLYANASVFNVYYSNGSLKATGVSNVISTGTGATFDVGTLTATETVALYTDLLTGRNEANTQYISPQTLSDQFDSQNDTSDIALCGLAPTGEVQIANGTFQDVYIVDGGSGYAITDTITVDNTKYANGSAVVGDQGSGLTLSIDTVDGSGGILQISVDDGGQDYTYLPEITIAGGTGADVIPLMGYGFPAKEVGSLKTLLSECLTILNAEIGTIRTIRGINPGEGYNYEPFVVVLNKFIKSFDRRDFVITVADRSGFFAVGETVQQNTVVTTPTISVGNAVTNSDINFIVGETVSQRENTSAVGTVISWSSTSDELVLDVATGTFDTSNSVYGFISGAEYDVTSVDAASTTTTVAKGEIRDIQITGTSSKLDVKRTSFNTSFNTSGTLSGATSGASGTIREIEPDLTRGAMGDNANVTTTATTADGVASQVEVLDSGIGYVAGEEVTLEIADSNYVVTANTLLGTSGQQEGYWRSQKHFTSSADSIIQDNDKYQEFSYIVKTGISFEKYQEVLKELIHVAGVKLFGEVIKISDLDIPLTSGNSVITVE